MTLWPGHPDRNPFSGEVGHGHVFDAEQQRETSVSEVLYSGQYWGGGGGGGGDKMKCNGMDRKGFW